MTRLGGPWRRSESRVATDGLPAAKIVTCAKRSKRIWRGSTRRADATRWPDASARGGTPSATGARADAPTTGRLSPPNVDGPRDCTRPPARCGSYPKVEKSVEARCSLRSFQAVIASERTCLTNTRSGVCDPPRTAPGPRRLPNPMGPGAHGDKGPGVLKFSWPGDCSGLDSDARRDHQPGRRDPRADRGRDRLGPGTPGDAAQRATRLGPAQRVGRLGVCRHPGGSRPRPAIPDAVPVRYQRPVAIRDGLASRRLHRDPRD